MQKNKHVLKKLAVCEMSESINLSRDVKRVILDNAFWEANATMEIAAIKLLYCTSD